MKLQSMRNVDFINNEIRSLPLLIKVRRHIHLIWLRQRKHGKIKASLMNAADTKRAQMSLLVVVSISFNIQDTSAETCYLFLWNSNFKDQISRK